MSKARQIIDLFFQNNFTEEDREKFFSWLVRPVSPRERDEAMHEVWNELHIEADESTQESFRQVQKKIHLQPEPKERSLYLKIARIAAIFTVPLMSVLFAYLYIRNYQPVVPEIVEHFVPNGQIREIVLPDSSRVVINSGSILLYPENFAGEKRNIFLNGEAKFTVKQNQEKPFVVKTCDMDVEALGTVFNVSSYADAQQTIATLASGKVRIGFKTAADIFSQTLTPSEQLIFERTTGEVNRKIVRTDYVLAWEHGHLVFQSVSLQQIVKSLERRSDVMIYLNSGSFTNEKITVKFLYGETLDEILLTLQHIIKGFKYKIEDKKVYIYY